MAGANIFVMYTDSTGQNVTVSPRLGTGNVQPDYNAGARITVLGGSGVQNGVMTANVKCSSCSNWQGGSMDLTSSSAEWIWAVRSGQQLNSDSPREDISEHNGADHFTWSLQYAVGGDEVNPFVAAASTGGTSPFNSSTADDAAAQSESQSSSDLAMEIHGVVAAVAIAIFVVGAVLVRLTKLRGIVWIHTGLQMIGVVMYVAALALGIYLAITEDLLDDIHSIIGIILFGLLLAQIPFGLYHHRAFKKHQSRTLVSYLHLFNGRLLIFLGIVNGALGLRLAGQERGKIIAYAVGAGIVGLLYIAAIVVGEMRRKREANAGGHRRKDLHE